MSFVVGASSEGVPFSPPPVLSDCPLFNYSMLLYLQPTYVFHQLWRLPSTPEDPPYGALRRLAFLIHELGLQEVSDTQEYAGSGRKKMTVVLSQMILLYGSTAI